MSFGTWDTLFNLLLLIFWLRLWKPSGHGTLFNPYLASAERVGGGIVGFLRPAFFFLSDRMVTLVALLLVLTLRAFAAPRTGTGWVLHVGFAWRQPQEGVLISALAFSLLSFAIFLFNIWSVAILFLRVDAARDGRATVGALQELARPFSATPYPLRPLVLLVAGTALVLALHRMGVEPLLNSPPLPGITAAGSALTPTAVLAAAVAALSGWVDVFGILVQTMIILIIGSWVSLFTGSPGTAHACRDWTEYLLGPMRRVQLQIGPIDLAPIVYIFLLGAVQKFLQAPLLLSYHRLTGAG